MSTDLLRCTLSEIAARIQREEVSPVKLVEEMIKKIESVNKSLDAYITILKRGAIKDAERAEHKIKKGIYLGPLHGIPIAVKDNIFIKNVRCTVGSKIFANRIAGYDATVVKKIKKAGAVIIGTTNLHEFASGATNINPFYGSARNPWDHDRMTGGSSGGSAASVSAGLAYAALGTDTSGSVRIPASLCGVVGLKPTFGRVSLFGVVPLSHSLDHVGVLARTVLDSALVLQSIAGIDDSDPSTIKSEVPDYISSIGENVQGMRVGVIPDYFQDMLSDEVSECFSAFLERLTTLGVHTKAIKISDLKHIHSVWSTIRFSEASAFHFKWINSRPSDYGTDVLEKLKFGLSYTAVEYIKSLEIMQSMRERFSRLFKNLDALVVPATPITAPRLDQTEVKLGSKIQDVYSMLTRLAYPFNVLGAPAMSIPIGLSREGLPVGAQIVGGPLMEERILRLGHQYEHQYGQLGFPNLGHSR